LHEKSARRTYSQIHIYREAFLVSTILLDEVATSLTFGRFGREEGALVNSPPLVGR